MLFLLSLWIGSDPSGDRISCMPCPAPGSSNDHHHSMLHCVASPLPSFHACTARTQNVFLRHQPNLLPTVHTAHKASYLVPCVLKAANGELADATTHQSSADSVVFHQ